MTTNRIPIAVFKNPISKKKCKHAFMPTKKRVKNGYIVLHVCKNCGEIRCKPEPDKFNSMLRKEIKTSL